MPGTARKPARKPAAKAAPRPADVEVTSVSAWKKQKEGYPLELPSGNIIRVRNASFQTFMKVGIIPNSLMAVVQSAIDKGKEPAMEELISGESQLVDMVQMVDDVLCFVAIEPKVLAVPPNEEDRSEDLLYVDEVDDEDKMFVFGVCTGGTRDVEQFRRESANSLAALQ